jgi:hypothetical protein
MTARLKRLMAALCMMMPLVAAAAPPSEYEVKAAFIHNIAKFVDWPAALPPSGSARLCLLGSNPFGNALDTLQGKPLGRLNWEVVQPGSGNGLKNCRVLFIAASERDSLENVLQSVGGSPVLTMGDTAGYAERGVMVNFYLEENKVRFEINREAAARAGIGISSQLLRLARIVREEGGAAR